MATIDDIIANQQATVSQAITNANSYAGRVTYFQPSQANPQFSYTPGSPNLSAPLKFSEFLPVDTTESLRTFLDDQVEAMLAKFFPNLLSAQTSPEDWAAAIIGGEDPYGESRAVFDSVWQQSRDNEAASRRTSNQRIAAEFAARGFSIPPGAMLGAMLEIEQASADAVAQVNRDEMRRATEIKLNLLQFAAQQASQLKLGMLGVLADFYRQWIELPTQYLEQARVKAQLYSSFNQAMASYWNVELGWEQLAVECKRLKAETAISVDRNRSVSLQGADSRNSALGQIANAMSNIAASASEAQSALALSATSGS